MNFIEHLNNYLRVNPPKATQFYFVLGWLDMENILNTIALELDENANVYF